MPSVGACGVKVVALELPDQALGNQGDTKPFLLYLGLMQLRKKSIMAKTMDLKSRVRQLTIRRC